MSDCITCRFYNISNDSCLKGLSNTNTVCNRYQDINAPQLALNKQVGGNHYKHFTIQPVEFIIKNNIPFLEGNVIKYVVRHGFKNGVEDLKKAKHYIDLAIELYYECNEK